MPEGYGSLTTVKYYRGNFAPPLYYMCVVSTRVLLVTMVYSYTQHIGVVSTRVLLVTMVYSYTQHIDVVAYPITCRGAPVGNKPRGVRAAALPPTAPRAPCGPAPAATQRPLPPASPAGSSPAAFAATCGARPKV